MLLLLAGCGQKQTVEKIEPYNPDIPLINGTYTITGDPDDNGVFATHSITIENGQINQSQFSYYDAKGFEVSKQNETLEKYTDELNQKLLRSKDPDTWTTSDQKISSDFQALSIRLIQNAQKGNDVPDHLFLNQPN